MDSKYKNAKIYTIRYRNDNNLIYVGATIQPLYKRFHEHKSRCFNIKDKEHDKLLYLKMRETNDINNWYIELYENYPCNFKYELAIRENQIIREIGTLNKYIKIDKEQEKELDELLKNLYII